MMMHYAGLDARINAGIAGYETALKAANVPYTLFMYDGVNHAFHNDTSTERYDAKAATLAFDRTVAFFRQSLGGASPS
jgi:carboxymethylenebutenolidase